MEEIKWKTISQGSALSVVRNAYMTVLIMWSASQQTWMISCTTESIKKATIRVIYVYSGSYIKWVNIMKSMNFYPKICQQEAWKLEKTDHVSSC